MKNSNRLIILVLLNAGVAIYGTTGYFYKANIGYDSVQKPTDLRGWAFAVSNGNMVIGEGNLYTNNY